MQKRIILISAVAAVAAIILLGMSLNSTLAVNRIAQRRLTEMESNLRSLDEKTAKSIESLFGRTDHFSLLMARQQHPRTEWYYLLEELKEAHQQFLDNPRNESELPYHTASSRLFLGRLLMMHGNRDRAFELIEKSIESATQLRDPVTVAKAKNTLGCLVAADGDYQTAFEMFRESSTILNGIEGLENLRAISLRNLGLIERALGSDGTASLRRAVALTMNSSDTASWGFTNELVQDLRMVLCEVYWSQGRINEATELARQTRDDLKTKFIDVDLPAKVDKHVIARNRYTTAYQLARRNLDELQQLQDAVKSQSLSDDGLKATVSRWQWNTLFDVNSELISVHIPVSGTMTGEFEPQSGLVVAWGTLDFNHSAVTQIVKATYDRTQLIIVSDFEESLEEAQAALEEAGVPTDRIRFAISDCRDSLGSRPRYWMRCRQHFGETGRHASSMCPFTSRAECCCPTATD